MAKLMASARKFLERREGARRLRSLKGGPIKLIIGASGTDQEGFTPTDQAYLDLLAPEQWRRFFEPDSIAVIFAEHVWEHLSPADARRAARTCHEFLARGGYLRVAVPDGLHPNPDYVDRVRPGGSGPEAHEHQVLYTHATFRQVFEQVGFRVELLEYFDETGAFHASPWDPAGGLVRRSARFDQRNVGGALVYTSVILDAVK